MGFLRDLFTSLSLGPNDDPRWEEYEFTIPYDYTLQGAVWTCNACGKLARRYPSNGHIACRCEHCGEYAHWLGSSPRNWTNRDINLMTEEK
jgi:hypothetical protein